MREGECWDAISLFVYYPTGLFCLIPESPKSTYLGKMVVVSRGGVGMCVSILERLGVCWEGEIMSPLGMGYDALPVYV
jgi:hypothetical protein